MNETMTTTGAECATLAAPIAPREPTTYERLAFGMSMMPRGQWLAVKAGMRGEERQHFVDLLRDYTARFLAMPATYATDGQGDAAVVWLHYFSRGSDWYITERDCCDTDGAGQVQAFGYVVLNGDDDCAESGYINILELVAAGVELDLYWTPRPLRDVKRGGRP